MRGCASKCLRLQGWDGEFLRVQGCAEGGGGNSDQFGLGCFGLTAPLAALATPLGLRSLVGKTGTAMSGVSLSYPPLQVDHLTGVVHYNGRR